MWELIKSNTCVLLQLITLSTMLFTSLATLAQKVKISQKLAKDISSINKEIKDMKEFYTSRAIASPPIIETILFLWFDYYKRHNGLKMDDITRMSTTLSAVRMLYPDIKYIKFLEKELIIMYKKQKGDSHGFSNSK